MIHSAKAWVFQVHAEILPSPKSQMAADYANEPIAGAFVNIYVPANSLEEAIDIAKAALAKNEYRLIGLEWVIKLEFEEWEIEEGEPSLSQLEELLNSNDYLFGRFYVYGSSDAH